MSLPIEFREKPIECISATALILIGIAAGFLPQPWAAPIGTAVAALGGALLSYAIGSVNLREKAAKQLEPELQSMARHLADTAVKLSRTVQSFYQGETESDVTIDRIGQLISSIYASLNDIHVIAGTTTNYQTLVDTVRGCEDMAARLEELTTRAGASTEEVEALREQLENARIQLEFGDISSERREETVSCPSSSCSNTVTVKLGTRQGDSASSSCPRCATRFHVHRAAGGAPFTKSMGSPTAPTHRKSMEVSCPTCKANVPLNFDTTKPSERRFCMSCCSALTILPSGEIANVAAEKAVDTETIGFSGARQVMKCPQCSGSYHALWSNSDFARAACPTCGILLQTPRKVRDNESSPPPTNKVA